VELCCRVFSWDDRGEVEVNSFDEVIEAVEFVDDGGPLAGGG
jgi:hypothetical protein